MRSLLIVWCFLCIVLQLNATGHYSIVAPGTIRPNTKYTVVLTVHNAECPCQIEMAIVGPAFNDTKIIQISAMSTKSVTFTIPPQLPSDTEYKLRAKGMTGIIFDNSTKLSFADYAPMIFIQTDKATYKPGDMVQYRVLFVNENTRPARIEDPVTLLIYDGAKNRIQQLHDIVLSNGVYTGRFQLSDRPLLGKWLIKIEYGQELIRSSEKSFEVAKYVLPKFEVSIETAKDVAIADGIIRLTVRSKYTYGKSVKGRATVTAAIFNHGVARTNIAIDGKGNVEFDLIKHLKIPLQSEYLQPVKIVAVVEDELTGIRQNTTTNIKLHAQRYIIQGIEVPNVFSYGAVLKYKVVVLNIDGSPVLTSTETAKLLLEPAKTSYESNLDEQGIATFEFVPSDERLHSVECSFGDTTVHLTDLWQTTEEETEGQLQLRRNTTMARLGEDIEIHINSPVPLNYLIYTVTARGNILRNELVTLSGASSSHTIRFASSFEMVPRATVFVHYVRDNELYFAEVSVDFEEDFENSIKLSTVTQAKPAENVKLEISTDRGSFVGLLGVDQSVLLLKAGNDLSKQSIFNNLSYYDTVTPAMRGYGRYPGATSGLVTLTNANYPYNKENDVYFSQFDASEFGFRGGSDREDVENTNAIGSEIDQGANKTIIKENDIELRTFFPDSWIFTNFENTTSNTFDFNVKIPDTITSWMITGFSLNPKTGLALTEHPTKIQVFKSFFVTTNLPYAVKRGEIISVPVIVFNYLKEALDVTVSLDNTDNDYDFIDAEHAKNIKTDNASKRLKILSIPANMGLSVSFLIRPKRVGSINLNIAAVTALAGDRIQQRLIVEPEGITQYRNLAYFMNVHDNIRQRKNFAVHVPDNVVPDSLNIELTVIGELFGPTIENFDRLVRMPSGCGEQNMINFVPNILVLQYLEAINKTVPVISEKARQNIATGYQQQLNYKHADGSYSAFGPEHDRVGSTWLTAYVARFFRHATKYTDIDENNIDDALKFLSKHQNPNGSFRENGHFFEVAHQNAVGLTAFVLLTFLENMNAQTKYADNIARGVQFLVQNIDQTQDQYALAIATLALKLAQNPMAGKLLKRMLNMSKREQQMIWWSNRKEQQRNEQLTTIGNDVEITGYILLAMFEDVSVESLMPIIQWLLAQRNNKGGYYSTQDTVVGLQALIKFAEKTGASEHNIDMVFRWSDTNATDAKVTKQIIRLTNENSLVLQTHVLPPSARHLTLSAVGQGSAIIQLSYNYNILDQEVEPSFMLSANVRSSTSKQLELEVCTEYQGMASNMAVMEVALPTGYTADVDTFDRITQVQSVKRVDTKRTDSTIIVYFDSLRSGDVKCIPITAHRTYDVAEHKPVGIMIYDYYDTSRKALTYYSINAALCDICESTECAADCIKH